MIDIASKLKAMKASWVYKLKNEDSDWNVLGNEYLNSLGENNLTLYYNFTNSKQFPLISSIPIFYQNMILAYNEAKTIITPDSHLQLLDEVLWGNVLFTCYNGMSRQHETLFFRNWVSSGIITVRCLKFTDGHVDEQYVYNTISVKETYIVKYK